jgi:RimJ/RimL family protein N-acetyltransferase
MCKEEYPLGKQGDIIIRRAVKEDARALLDYLKIVGGETENLAMDGRGIGDDVEAEQTFLEAKHETMNSIQLLAIDGERIVGCLSVDTSSRKKIRHRGEVGLSVIKDYWGRGIGTSLLGTMLVWARTPAAGLRKLDLTVRADNKRAISLYRHFGFAEEGHVSRLFYVDGQFIDGIVMGLLID